MSAANQFGIRRAGAHVNLADLSVEHRERIRRLFAAAERSGLGVLEVYSGARTFALQSSLYKAFLQRGRRHPVVASPTYVSSRTGRAGSAHQVQAAGKYRHGNLPNLFSAAYATDVRWANRRPPTAAQQQKLHSLARIHGLYPSVSTEWWHLVCLGNKELLAVAGFGHTGAVVQQIQSDLNKISTAKLVVDGSYGPATMSAVILFQQTYNKDHVSGDWMVADRVLLGQVIEAAAKKTPPQDKVRVDGEIPVEWQMRRALRRIISNGTEALDLWEESDGAKDVASALRRVASNTKTAQGLVDEF